MVSKKDVLSKFYSVLGTLTFVFLLIQSPTSTANLMGSNPISSFKSTLACQETAADSAEESTDQKIEPPEEEPDCD
jgi:hypothetical protein